MKTKFIFIFFLVFATSLWANSTDNLVFSSFYEKNDFKESGSFQLIKDIQLDLEKGFYSLVIEKTKLSVEFAQRDQAKTKRKIKINLVFIAHLNY